jgi:hypothetical protein
LSASAEAPDKEDEQKEAGSKRDQMVAASGSLVSGGIVVGSAGASAATTMKATTIGTFDLSSTSGGKTRNTIGGRKSGTIARLRAGASSAQGSGSGNQASGESDVLDSVAVALSLTRQLVSKGYEGPLKPHNQLSEDRCVCASMATAMWLRAVLTCRVSATREFLRRNLASASFLYDAQRRLACKETSRCDCGPQCADACDPHCGSLLSNVERIARRGTVFARDFPDRLAGDADMILAAQSPIFLQTKPILRLEIARKRRPDASGAKAQRAVKKLLRQKCPCLLNLYVYPNQMRWARTMRIVQKDKDAAGKAGKKNKPKGSHSTDASASKQDKVEDLRTKLPWTSEAFRMPAPQGKAQPVGHCVTAVGLSADGSLVRIRNSFGTKWGCHGDFNMPLSQIVGKQVDTVMGIVSVSLGNIR